MRLFLIFLSVLSISACSHLKREYGSPFEDYIIIEGEITNSQEYLVRVDYWADPQKCKSRVFLYDGPASYSYSYYPRIVGNSHHLKLPMKVLDPETNCSWKPYFVWICVGAKGSKLNSCASLFVVGQQNFTHEESVKVECGGIFGCRIYQPAKPRKDNRDILNKRFTVIIDEKRT